MNTLKEKILADRISAMKSGNTELKTILSTIIGELDRISKTPTDDQVIKVIKNIIDANKEIGSDSALAESKLIEGYLPKMISEEELTSIIEKIIKDNLFAGMKDMGKVMKELSGKYAGMYNGTVASGIVKNLLQ